MESGSILGLGEGDWTPNVSFWWMVRVGGLDPSLSYYCSQSSKVMEGLDAEEVLLINRERGEGVNPTGAQVTVMYKGSS